MESLIQRIGAGAINAGSGDTYIGHSGGMLGPARSHFAGQLGQSISLPADQILYSSTIGTLYGGTFRYVRLRSTDSAPAIGQIAFWDTTLTSWQTGFQVTTSEALSSVDNAIMIAGIFINVITPGNYWFIQTAGMVPVKFRAVLTDAGAIGSACFAAGVGAGASNACADVLSDANAVAFSDASLLMRRYLGKAVVAPTGGALSAVLLGFQPTI